MSWTDHAPRRDTEGGFALPLVLLLVVVIGAIAAVIFNSARFETRSTGEARDYEAALHNAESALEVVFADMLAGETLPAVDWQGPQPGTDRASERAEVLRQIQVLGADAVTVQTPDGLAMAVGPFEALDGHDYVYGVAGIGTGDVVDADQVRIVRTRLADVEVDAVPPASGAQAVTFGSYALHLNSSLQISGHVQSITGGGIAANGDLTVRQALGEKLRVGNLTIASATGDIVCSDSWCPVFRQTAGHPAPMAGSVATTTPPVLAARDVHRRYAAEIGDRPGVGDWYDLCYADPAQGRPYPAVHAAPTTPGAEPCTGEKIQDITGSWPNRTFRGWRYETVNVRFFGPTGIDQSQDIEMWTNASGEGGYPENGVYYAHERNVMTSNLWSTSARLTIIASADTDDLAENYGARSGNIWWQGNSHYNHYDGVPGMQLAAFADRDVVAQGTAKADGIVYAREQFRSYANDFRIIGSGQAAGVPIGPVGATAPADQSSPGSPIHQTTAVLWGQGGSFRFDYQGYGFEVDPGPDAVDPGDPPPPPLIQVRTWDEL
ncbi:MAG TPA: hypothetical protein VK906_01675 [Egicoccus sp.]|nr:hypothetical protein [Egicoccus sp.]HSK21850.1 hypothetical protein [Egicoccus sp.]